MRSISKVTWYPQVREHDDVCKNYIKLERRELRAMTSLPEHTVCVYLLKKENVNMVQ